MDDSKIKELRLIHRDLAAYLKKQHETTNNAILAVTAIREVFRQNPALQKSYEASLRDLKDDVTIQPTLTHAQTLTNLLKRLTEW